MSLSTKAILRSHFHLATLHLIISDKCSLHRHVCTILWKLFHRINFIMGDIGGLQSKSIPLRRQNNSTISLCLNRRFLHLLNNALHPGWDRMLYNVQGLLLSGQLSVCSPLQISSFNKQGRCCLVRSAFQASRKEVANLQLSSYTRLCPGFHAAPFHCKDWPVVIEL